MKDTKTTLEEIKQIVKNFCHERDWDQFHNAKDLAIGAVTESSELLEHFRFLSYDQVEELMRNSEKKKEVAFELCDVLFFLVRLSERYNIDLAEYFTAKMEQNAQRYPVANFKGKNHKAEH